MTSGVRYLTFFMLENEPVGGLRYVVGVGVRIMGFAAFILFLIWGALVFFESTLIEGEVQWMISPPPLIRFLKSMAAGALWGILILVLPMIANWLQFDR